MDEENDSCDEETSCTVGINKFVRSQQDRRYWSYRFLRPCRFNFRAEEVGEKVTCSSCGPVTIDLRS